MKYQSSNLIDGRFVILIKNIQILIKISLANQRGGDEAQKKEREKKRNILFFCTRDIKWKNQ